MAIEELTIDKVRMKKYDLVCGHHCLLRIVPAGDERHLWCSRCQGWRRMAAEAIKNASAQRVRTNFKKLKPIGDGERSKPRKYMGYAIAREIRELYRAGYGRTAIAEKFGVNPRTVYDVVNNVTWKEVK